MADANLRKIFAKYLPMAQWTPVETGTTAQGVPDAEYCFPTGRGECPCQGWVEFKRTTGWKVVIRPEQVGWLLRRSRLGGRCFVAVRQLGRDRDTLWLIRGVDAGHLISGELPGPYSRWVSMEGGPGHWDWLAVRNYLCS